MQYMNVRAGMVAPANDNASDEISGQEVNLMVFAINALNAVVQTSATLPRDRLMTMVGAISALRDHLTEYCIQPKSRG